MVGLKRVRSGRLLTRVDDIVSSLLKNKAVFINGVDVANQLEDNAACGLIEDKFHEILGFFPLLAECIEHYSFTKDKALIVFKNGSRLTNLANHQSSKGKRRHSESKLRFSCLNVYAATIE